MNGIEDVLVLFFTIVCDSTIVSNQKNVIKRFTDSDRIKHIDLEQLKRR